MMDWWIACMWQRISKLWKPPTNDEGVLRPAWIIRALREHGWKPEPHFQTGKDNVRFIKSGRFTSGFVVLWLLIPLSLLSALFLGAWSYWLSVRGW